MPSDENKENVETQSDDLDLSEAQAEISSELFGQGNDEEGKDKDESQIEGEGDESSGAGNDTDAADPSRQQEKPDAEKDKVEGETATTEEENSEAVQETGAPKTWTKEALEEWAKVPPRAQQEIIKREEDFLRGITQYREAADLGVKYSKVVEPYAPILAAENIDPVGLFQSFAANHYLLSRGTEEQKIELAANMLQGYGIPLEPLVNYLANNGGIKQSDPEVEALRKEVHEIKTGISSRTERENSVAKATIDKEIEAFAADPAHPYFDEVAGDIGKLFESGMASTLAEAYEKAVYANPATRAKEIDRLTTERTSAREKEENERKAKRAKSQADQVKSGQKPKDGTVPKGTMDDTLRETMDAIESRG